MAVTYGFYDSLNHDRLYNAQQMSAIFDGIINDGVFMSVGNQFHTVAGTGMQVIVKSGRAWFDSTWTLNDAEYPLSIDAADVLLTRIDAVVLEVNSEVATRANTIKVVKGTPASTPAKPTLTNTATIHQHALAYVTVAKNTTAITNSMIEIVVGKTETPYVTAILQTTDITDLFKKWENDFQVWFETVKGTLDGDVALNLQNQIDHRVKKADKATSADIEAGTADKWVDASLFSKEQYKIGDVLITKTNNKIGDKWVLCNGEPLDKSTDLYDKINNESVPFDGMGKWTYPVQPSSSTVLTSTEFIYTINGLATDYNPVMNRKYYISLVATDTRKSNNTALLKDLVFTLYYSDNDGQTWASRTYEPIKYKIDFDLGDSDYYRFNNTNLINGAKYIITANDCVIIPCSFPQFSGNLWVFICLFSNGQTKVIYDKNNKIMNYVGRSTERFSRYDTDNSFIHYDMWAVGSNSSEYRYLLKTVINTNGTDARIYVRYKNTTFTLNGLIETTDMTYHNGYYLFLRVNKNSNSATVFAYSQAYLDSEPEDITTFTSQGNKDVGYYTAWPYWVYIDNSPAVVYWSTGSSQRYFQASIISISSSGITSTSPFIGAYVCAILYNAKDHKYYVPYQHTESTSEDTTMSVYMAVYDSKPTLNDLVKLKTNEDVHTTDTHIYQNIAKIITNITTSGLFLEQQSTRDIDQLLYNAKRFSETTYFTPIVNNLKYAASYIKVNN